MARAVPIPLKERVKRNRRAKNKRKLGVEEVVAPGVEPSKSVEVKYRKDLNMIINEMVKDIIAGVLPIIRSNEIEFKDHNIKDQPPAFIVTIKNALKAVEAKYSDITPIATAMATDMVEGEAKNSQAKFQKSIQKATGINLARIISEESLEETMESQIARNINLIQSVPDEYFKKLNEIVFRNITAGSTAGGIAKEIEELTGITRNKAKLIARDQTAKTNAAISKTRQEELGVSEYVWQTSEDERVRTSHVKNNGKTFKWDKPPPITGHPGDDVNCRCIAKAVINLE